MANAESYRGVSTPFFPLQGPRVERGGDVRIPSGAANAEQPPVATRLTQADEDAVWARYDSMPPSTDAMKKASNIGGSRRWIIPGVLAAAFVAGIGYAALTDRPAPIAEPSLAANEAATDTSAAALTGSAPVASDPIITPQSTFDTAQPRTIAPPPSATPPGAATSNGAVERSARPPVKPAPSVVKATNPVTPAEPPMPASTYSRGDAPATTLPAPDPVPEAGTTAAPAPRPDAIVEAPPANMELARPSETVPAPAAVPENAQTPQ